MSAVGVPAMLQSWNGFDQLLGMGGKVMYVPKPTGGMVGLPLAYTMSLADRLETTGL